MTHLCRDTELHRYRHTCKLNCFWINFPFAGISIVRSFAYRLQTMHQTKNLFFSLSIGTSWWRMCILAENIVRAENGCKSTCVCVVVFRNMWWSKADRHLPRLRISFDFKLNIIDCHKNTHSKWLPLVQNHLVFFPN